MAAVALAEVVYAAVVASCWVQSHTFSPPIFGDKLKSVENTENGDFWQNFGGVWRFGVRLTIYISYMRTPADVLLFWFRDRSAINTRSVLGPSMKNWFDGDKEFVQRQYDSKALVDQAINGALTGGDWETSDGALAKIILADQFARVVYARLPEAFAGEAVALENAYKLIEEKWMEDERVNAAERLFAVMPLLHSEKIADHLTLQSLVPTMSRLAPEDIRDMVVATKFFEDHYLVIKQFGRFPSRNAILCRLNTPEEEAYLSSPDLPGWAKSQMKA